MDSQTKPTTGDRFAFETSLFGVNQSGFHLLRNGYNYKSYPLSEIRSMEIKKGPEIRNWFIILILGIALLGFALKTLFGLWYIFNNDTHIYIEQILLPLFPLLIGGYCLFASLKRTKVIVLHLESGKDVFPLTKLVKAKKEQEFIEYVRTYIGGLNIRD